MTWTRRCCVFVDGENLRHSLIRALPDHFEKRDYLPKSAQWTAFFSTLVANVSASPWGGTLAGEGTRSALLRVYWYVTQSVDFWPSRVPEGVHGVEFLGKHSPRKHELKSLSPGAAQLAWAQERIVELNKTREIMQKRFDGWSQVHRAVAEEHDYIEFRSAGVIKFDLFTGKMGPEKGVDVKLATDLLVLRDAYDIAIIVSGDSDYVPAVQAIKDMGKTVLNVEFLNADGKPVTGGSRRLSQLCDRTFRVHNENLKQLFTGGRHPGDRKS